MRNEKEPNPRRGSGSFHNALSVDPPIARRALIHSAFLSSSIAFFSSRETLTCEMPSTRPVCS